MTDTEFLIQDFKEHPVQSSWDFEADLRFARAIGDKEAADLLRRMLKPSSFLPGVLAAFGNYIRPRITRRRLKAIRKLVKQGLVEAEWRGTGYGGKTEFGVNRARAYFWKEWRSGNAD